MPQNLIQTMWKCVTIHLESCWLAPFWTKIHISYLYSSKFRRLSIFHLQLLGHQSQRCYPKTLLDPPSLPLSRGHLCFILSSSAKQLHIPRWVSKSLLSNHHVKPAARWSSWRWALHQVWLKCGLVFSWPSWHLYPRNKSSFCGTVWQPGWNRLLRSVRWHCC